MLEEIELDIPLMSRLLVHAFAVLLHLLLGASTSVKWHICIFKTSTCCARPGKAHAWMPATLRIALGACLVISFGPLFWSPAPLTIL